MAELPNAISLTHALPARDSYASELVQAEVIELFDTHQRRLLRYILSFGLTLHDGEDVVQEVFLALFRHLQMGRSRKDLRAWIFRVGHNLALKRCISRSKSEKLIECDALVLEQCTDPQPDPEQDFAFRQRQQHLLNVVRAMPEHDERCLRLRAEGLKYREIAQVLGISLGSVSIALTRSLARLQRADWR